MKPLVFFVHLIQDLDLLLPLAKKLRAQGEPAHLLVHRETLGTYPEIPARLSQFTWSVFEGVFKDWMRWPLRARGVVTACDANVPAHRHGNRFAKASRLFGTPTFSLQHGFENIGLSYSDEEYPLENIRFASRYVLTWGNALATVPASTRRKIQPVGILKEKPPPRNRRKQVVVFENLHWGRYSEEYRDTFLDSLKKISRELTQYQFLLKPHAAGKWGERLQGESFEVVDRTRSATDLIAESAVVITTPSTIAVDAAMAGTPVGVVGGDLAVEMYEPLPILRHFGDWKGLIQSVESNVFPTETLENFLSRHSVGRDGLDVAVQFVLSHS